MNALVSIFENLRYLNLADFAVISASVKFIGAHNYIIWLHASWLYKTSPHKESNSASEIHVR